MAASPLFPVLPADWKEEIITFARPALSLRIWFNPQRNRGRTLYIIHGFGEQSDRYLHFPHYLHTAVDTIAALDLPGHGHSEGPRGHCSQFQDLVKAALAGFARLKHWHAERNESPPLHWFGHSMGGLLTLQMMMRHPDLELASVVVSAPQLAIAVPIPALKKLAGELISPFLPRLTMKSEIDGAKLSRDLSVAEEYARNPLNHSLVTPRMFTEMGRAMRELGEWSGPLPYSTMMVLPLRDEIVSAPMSLFLWQRWPVASGCRKELSMWPGAFHEAFNDYDKLPLFNRLETWLRGEK